MNKDAYIKEHFPEVTPGAVPCGNKVLVQLRTMKAKSSGGIFIPNETKDFNNGNTQLASVVSLGQIAFKHRETGEDWKEGAWAKVGDVVIVPRWGGFRFEVPVPGTDDKAIFAVFEDYTLNLLVESFFTSW